MTFGVKAVKKDGTHYKVFAVNGRTRPDGEKAANEQMKRDHLNPSEYNIELFGDEYD